MDEVAVENAAGNNNRLQTTQTVVIDCGRNQFRNPTSGGQQHMTYYTCHYLLNRNTEMLSEKTVQLITQLLEYLFTFGSNSSK